MSSGLIGAGPPRSRSSPLTTLPVRCGMGQLRRGMAIGNKARVSNAPFICRSAAWRRAVQWSVGVGVPELGAPTLNSEDQWP